ncbi:MAG: elongation factor 1-beta [Thaumarchaeota archaeon]|nr:elongation factor 1-beta [Nitrososphaerota archaeon]
MTKLVARIKVLPTDIDIDLNVIVDRLNNSIVDDIKIKNFTKEPIAFGLNALIMDFLLEDKEGQMDELENAIKNTEGVSEIEIMNLSRQALG